ncbi:hypothetical protein RhiirC2_362367 [Rhizophagus irregularis]|uniref:RNase H type-1 domain-containing protein n=1 Tax=Rhizophagus irregularis TaxID=588596 RepID=A0A2N1NG98_9GLOM|nr:hypothetical protein RhiirC2_362367 [Rhizophagus irregularis]
MGYGWCVSNSFEQKIFFNGTGTLMPSATKAEILAIVTALIIAPSYSSITIFTDSQAAIDGFNKSSQLRYISPRRFNKINNTILWAALHHNIQKLNLIVDLKKIRAHSDNLIMIELTYLQKKVDYWPFRLRSTTTISRLRRSLFLGITPFLWTQIFENVLEKSLTIRE